MTFARRLRLLRQGFPGLNAYLGLRSMTIYGFGFTSVVALMLPLPSLCVDKEKMEMLVRALRRRELTLPQPELLRSCAVCLAASSSDLFTSRSFFHQQGLYSALGLRGAAAVTVFTNAMMLVNAAAPPGQLGEVNGVGQAVGAFVRGFGPELIGLIWSWFIESGGSGAKKPAPPGLCAATPRVWLLRIWT